MNAYAPTEAAILRGAVLSDMLARHAYHGFDVSLLETEPPIWRRFQLNVDDTPVRRS